MTDKNLNEEQQEEELDIITLTLEDDSELDCEVIALFNLEDREYIALLPVETEDEDEREVLLYRFNEINEEEFEVKMIESEEEFEKVAEKYYEVASEDHADEDDDYDYSQNNNDCNCNGDKDCDCK